MSDQETIPQGEATPEVAAAPAPAAEKPAKSPRVVAPALVLKGAADGVDLAVRKYQMPVKAPRFPLSINGNTIDAATTEFKDKKYTYFTYNGVDFWVVGHLDAALAYTIAFPEGYTFAGGGNERTIQKASYKPKAKKAKAEAGAATEGDPANKALGGEESPPEGPNATAEGGSTLPGETPPESAPAPAPTKGKKATR